MLRCAQHHVAPIGQCPFGKRLKGVPPHDDGVARCKHFEAFQVVGQPIDELVLIANGPVSCHGCNDVYLHNHSFSELHRNLCLDMRQGVVAFECEIVVFKVEDAVDIGVNHHLGQCSWGALQLLFDLLQVV